MGLYSVYAQISLNIMPWHFFVCVYMLLWYHQLSVYANVYLEKQIKFYGSQLRYIKKEMCLQNVDTRFYIGLQKINPDQNRMQKAHTFENRVAQPLS